MPGGEILHKRIVSLSSQSHQITAKSNILGSKKDSHACRFERRATGMIDRRIIAHDAHVADVAPGRESIGYHVQQANPYSASWRPPAGFSGLKRPADNRPCRRPEE